MMSQDWCAELNLFCVLVIKWDKNGSTNIVEIQLKSTAYLYKYDIHLKTIKGWSGKYTTIILENGQLALRKLTYGYDIIDISFTEILSDNL